MSKQQQLVKDFFDVVNYAMTKEGATSFVTGFAVNAVDDFEISLVSRKARLIIKAHSIDALREQVEKYV